MKDLQYSDTPNAKVKHSYTSLFTKENLWDFFAQYRVIFYWLILFWATHLATKDINLIYENVKYSVAQTVNNSFWSNFSESKQQEVEKIFLQVREENNITDFNDPVFQEKLYQAIKSYDEITGSNILQSLILWFLYGFAYLKTIRRVKNEALPIDAKSFSTFSLTSWGMVLVNGFVPGSIVYLESFLLAGYAVVLHLKNVQQGKVLTNEFSQALKNSPFASGYFDTAHKPLVWNTHIKKLTWYSQQDIDDFYEENGEIRSLLMEEQERNRFHLFLWDCLDQHLSTGEIETKIINKIWDQIKVKLSFQSDNSHRGDYIIHFQWIGPHQT